jgi:hypothetical protein
MNNEISVVGFEPKTPIIVSEGNLSIEIGTESHQQPLTHKGYEAMQDACKILAQLESQLAGTDLSLETMIGQTVPTLRLLLPEGITLAQALESGRAFHVPSHPMTANEIIDGLIPHIARNSTGHYCSDILSKCAPLREALGGRDIHQMTPQDLEQLLKEVEEGQFLTDKQKRAILIRNKWTTPPLKCGRPKWYKDKTLLHFYYAWHRIFIRAKALGAWPLLRPLPTELMVKP